MLCDSCPGDVKKFPRMGKPVGFATQCKTCGRRGGWLDPLDLAREGVDPGAVLMANISRGSTGLGGEGNSGKRAYRKFMSSAAWKRQRERVLARDRYRCQDCGELATEVAHLKYADPIEKTPDRDVQASCRACNQSERENRIAFGRTAER